MYCSKCGAELGTDTVCPECGEQPQKYCSGRDVFSSNLFLAVCVFISLSAILSLFGSFFNIVLILACISVWLVYAQSSDASRSKNSGFVLAATTLGVEEILLWVVCGLFAVCGPVLLIISVATGSVIDYLVGVGADYGDQIGQLLKLFSEAMSTVGAFAVGVILMAVFLAAAAIAGAYNVLFVRYFRKVCSGLKNDRPAPAGALPRLLALGIITAVSAATNISSFSNKSSFLSLLSSLCLSAAVFLLYFLLKKRGQ